MLKEREPISKTGKLLDLMRIYGVSFDLDGVKVLTSPGAIKIYNKKWGIPYGLVKYHGDLSDYFSMTQWLTEINSLHRGKIQDPMHEAVSIWNNEENLRTAPVESGVISLLKLMYNHKVDPYDITSRPVSTKQTTEEWINNKLGVFGDLTNRLNMQEGENLNPEFKADRAELLKILLPLQLVYRKKPCLHFLSLFLINNYKNNQAH